MAPHNAFPGTLDEGPHSRLARMLLIDAVLSRGSGGERNRQTHEALAEAYLTSLLWRHPDLIRTVIKEVRQATAPTDISIYNQYVGGRLGLVAEESVTGRVDLRVTYRDGASGSDLRMELKLWAGLTEAQQQVGYAHLFIVPTSRQSEVSKKLPNSTIVWSWGHLLQSLWAGAADLHPNDRRDALAQVQTLDEFVSAVQYGASVAGPWEPVELLSSSLAKLASALIFFRDCPRDKGDLFLQPEARLPELYRQKVISGGAASLYIGDPWRGTYPLWIVGKITGPDGYFRWRQQPITRAYIMNAFKKEDWPTEAPEGKRRRKSLAEKAEEEFVQVRRGLGLPDQGECDGVLLESVSFLDWDPESDSRPFEFVWECLAALRLWLSDRIRLAGVEKPTVTAVLVPPDLDEAGNAYLGLRVQVESVAPTTEFLEVGIDVTRWHSDGVLAWTCASGQGNTRIATGSFEGPVFARQLVGATEVELGRWADCALGSTTGGDSAEG